jgi:transposase
VRNSNKESRIVTEKVVAYWSEHFAKRSMAENKSFLEFVSKLTDSPSNFKITSLQAKSLRRFLKEELINIKTGEVFDSSEIKLIVDTEKVKEFKKNMGYYQIITSELEMDPKEVIDKYHGLTRIEEQFRVMKSCLDARPVFVHNPNHIKGHLLICLISLIIMRIIQSKIVESGLALPSKKKIHKPLNWTSGLSAERIQNALNKWQVETLVDDYFRFNNINDPDLKLILEAFKIEIEPRLYRRGELKSIKTATEIFS